LKKKIQVIINPISGVGRKDRIIKAIDRFIDKDVFDTQVLFTSYPGHGAELCAEAVAQKTDIVVVAGGDGSINEAAGVLAHTPVTLGIIPAGSGNGLANFLQIPGKTNRALAVINRCKTEKIDTYLINSQRGCNVAGVGFDGRIAFLFNKKSKSRGFWSYLRIITSEYIRYKPGQYIMEIDGKPVTKNALLVCFANSNQFGNHARISPLSSAKDGLLEVCLLKKVPLIFSPVLGFIMLSGWIHKTRLVQYYKAKRITIQTKDTDYLHIDGDPVKFDRFATIKADPLSLNVIVP
jgi:YegS/Rv2252/BmrU family lipid kinase